MFVAPIHIAPKMVIKSSHILQKNSISFDKRQSIQIKLKTRKIATLSSKSRKNDL